MLNSRVSDSSSSPPALACFTTKRFTGRVAPRSTCRNKRPVVRAPPVGLASRDAAVHGLLRPLVLAAGQASRGGTAEREILRAVGPVDLELVDPGDRLPAVGRADDVQADEAGVDRRLDHVGRRPRVPGVLPDALAPHRPAFLGRLPEPLSSRPRPPRPPGRCPSGPAASGRAAQAARPGTSSPRRARRRSPRAAAPARRPTARAWQRRRGAARPWRSSTPVAARPRETARASSREGHATRLQSGTRTARPRSRRPARRRRSGGRRAQSVRARARTAPGRGSSPACPSGRRSA